jgi:hypothetical protein
MAMYSAYSTQFPPRPYSDISPRPSTSNILSQPITTNLLPLNLLPRNRQLPSQAFECTFRQSCKRLIQVLLISLLHLRDPSHNLPCPSSLHTYLHILISQQPDVPILIVVHIDLYGSCEGGL